jgi:hypothetical protein
MQKNIDPPPPKKCLDAPLTIRVFKSQLQPAGTHNIIIIICIAIPAEVCVYILYRVMRLLLSMLIHLSLFYSNTVFIQNLIYDVFKFKFNRVVSRLH